jgi:hypothetical protein
MRKRARVAGSFSLRHSGVNRWPWLPLQSDKWLWRQIGCGKQTVAADRPFIQVPLPASQEQHDF